MRPRGFDVNPDSYTVVKCWMHVLVTFENRLNFVEPKLRDKDTRINFVSHTIPEIIFEMFVQ